MIFLFLWYYLFFSCSIFFFSFVFHIVDFSSSTFFFFLFIYFFHIFIFIFYIFFSHFFHILIFYFCYSYFSFLFLLFRNMTLSELIVGATNWTIENTGIADHGTVIKLFLILFCMEMKSQINLGDINIIYCWFNCFCLYYLSFLFIDFPYNFIIFCISVNLTAVGTSDWSLHYGYLDDKPEFTGMAIQGKNK